MGQRDLYKWYVVIMFFLFLVFHEADRFIISGIASALMDEFKIGYSELGYLFTLTILVAAILYPLWGYLYDKYSRKLLVSLAAFIWGATTWINALAKTYIQFFTTRILTGIDDAAPPGIYAMVSDYFEPQQRGKAMGLINASAPIGAILGSVLALMIGMKINWRLAFYITGSIGIIIGILIYLTIRDIPRGSSEPELKGLLKTDIFTAKIKDLVKLLRNKSLLLLYLQGFFGVFPWNAITFWIVTYLIRERGLPEESVLGIMVSWLIMMMFGNIVGGILGDIMFTKTKRGRAIFGAIVVFLSAFLIYETMISPTTELLMIFGALTAFEIPMAGPNVSAAITDIIEPELRGSATSNLRLFENIGSALSPLVVGMMAEEHNLGYAITTISVSTWILCGIFFTILAIIIPKDIDRLRQQMRERAEQLLKT